MAGRRWGSVRKTRILILWALALLAILPFAGSAQATAVSFTQTFHNVTQVFMPPAPMASNPCSGVPGVLTLTYSGVAHGNVITSGIGLGSGWFTFTGTGTFSFVPTVVAPSYTGMFTAWDGENFNLQNFAATNTLVARGTGSDGSTLFFHGVMTVSILFQSGTPVVVVSFGNFSCG